MSNWERREINNLIPEKPEDYKKRFPKPFSSMIPADAGPDNKLATEEYVNSHSGGGGSTADAVKYTSQSLTDDQKAQARANIGAGTYDKPQTGIPASDLETGVIPDVSGKADKSDTPRVVSFQQDLDELPGEIIEELRLGDIVSCLGEPYEVIVRDSARIQLSVGGWFYEFVKTNDVWSYNTQGPYLESARLNKVTSLSAQSTDTQYPSAKAVVDYVDEHGGGDDEATEVTAAALNDLNSRMFEKKNLVDTYDQTVAENHKKAPTSYALYKFYRDQLTNEEIIAAALCDLNAIGAMASAIAPLYERGTRTFAVDDCCIYASQFYRCIAAVPTPEPFDPTKWVKTSLFEEMVRRFNAL